MKLHKLTIHNFKGIRSFSIEPNGESVAIYGDNRTGKTTVADAIVWILNDADTLGRTTDSMGIKTVDENGVIHGLEHSVEAVFDVVTLKKTYKEKWTKSRGSADKELTGHTTDYFVDDVPVKQKDYLAKLRELIDEELLRILSLPTYFPEQLHWKKRRDILFELVDDVNVDDIIEAHPNLSRYPEILNGKSEDDLQKILKDRKKKLNKQIDEIPTRIDEANRSIVEVGNADEARVAIQSLKTKRSALEAKTSEVKSGGSVADLKVKLQELEARKGELRNEHSSKLEHSISHLRTEVNALQDRFDDLSANLRTKKNEYEDAKRDLERASSAVLEIEQKYEEEKSKEPLSKDEPEECPYCGQLMKKQDYDEYLEHFNGEKAGILKEINEKLTEAVSNREETEQRLEKVKNEGVKIAGEYKQVETALNSKKLVLQEAKESVISVEDTDEFKAVITEQSSIQKRIDDHATEKQKALDQLQKAIEAVNAEIIEKESIIYQSDQNEKSQKRIAELKDERKKYAKELEQTEADLYLIEEFIRARSRYVTERINSKFEKVRWELFREQINGGIEEVCEAWYEGVPYSRGLNHSSRVKAGLEIINVLSNHFDKSVPVVVDNCEALTELPAMPDIQIIALYVSAEHKDLHIESIETKAEKEFG
jgi:DNA repair exonuclease SbcCD ATPase subunit